MCLILSLSIDHMWFWKKNDYVAISLFSRLQLLALYNSMSLLSDTMMVLCDRYKLGFCPNGPDCRYRHAKLPGPPPPVEEVLQKIQQLSSYNYGNSNKFLQNRNTPYSQQTEKPQFSQGPNGTHQVGKTNMTDSVNVHQQPPQQSQQQGSLVQTNNIANGLQIQPTRSAAPLPQGTSRCVPNKVFN